MKKHYKPLLTMLLALCASTVWAQNRAVSGRVTDIGDGSGLPGVSVAVKGTTTGTTTDATGKYTLGSVSDNATLVFSFIGFTSQEVAVGNRNTLDVRLVSDVKALQEVVVTALGVTRDKKALSYAVATASGDQLAQRSEPDALRSLSGKVPGVNITAGGGSPGQGTRITIRGNNSFTGNTQPLFVVDGIPFDNSVNASTGFNQASTFSNRAYDIDPNNIESMTVLKGAAAAALYGSRAANGVVVITTKAGSKNTRKGLEVTYNGSYSTEQISSIPDYQNVYGQGSNQNYNGGFIGNWGPPFAANVDAINAGLGFARYSKVIQPGVPEGQVRHPYTDPDVSFTSGRNYGAIFPELVGVTVPYTYHDIIGGFFRTGRVFENAINLSSTGDKTSLTAGFSRMSNAGMVPGSDSKRTSFNFGGNATLLNGLTLSGNVNYVNTTQENPQSGASFFADYGSGSTGSIYDRIFYLPRNFNLNEYPFENPVDGSNIFYRALDNPLWTAKYNKYTSNVNRVFGNMALQYNITPWLNLTAKGGVNTYSEARRNVLRKGGISQPLGSVWTDDITNTEVDFNFFATLDKTFGKDFGVRAIVGFNPNERSFSNRFALGTDIISSGLNIVSATADPRVLNDSRRQRRLFGVYGDMQLSFRTYAFLNLTGRNDWSSTLPKANNNYFYPSVSGTFVFTDAFKMDDRILSFGKVRASWAKVGKDADEYRIRNIYPLGVAYTNAAVAPGPLPNASLSNRLNNANLKPEFTTEVEFGTDLQFLQNRIGLDLTYFNRNSTDLIVESRLPASSGFTTQIVNAGKINNRGWEIGLNLVPVKLANGLTWTSFFAFTQVRSKIVDEGPAGPFILGGSPLSSLGTYIQTGQPYGMIFGTRNARDPEGNLLINELTGRPFPLATSQVIGDPNPDFTLGWTNTVTFKNFTLSGLLDWRQGGDMYSVTAASLLLRGQLKFSEDREAMRVVPGVYGNPATFEPILVDGNTVRNTTPVSAFDYHFTGGFGAYGADETNIYDVTTIRLRELTLGYVVPKAFLQRYAKFLGSFRLMLSGRNLWFKAPNMLTGLNFDPEVLSNFPDSNVQGFDLGAAPSSRRYGINISASF